MDEEVWLIFLLNQTTQDVGEYCMMHMDAMPHNQPGLAWRSVLVAGQLFSRLLLLLSCVSPAPLVAVVACIVTERRTDQELT